MTGAEFRARRNAAKLTQIELAKKRAGRSRDMVQYWEAKRGGRVVSVAVIIAVGVNTDGRREVLGMEIGTTEAEPV